MSLRTARARVSRRPWAALATASLVLATGCASLPSGSPCAEDIQGQFPLPNGTFVREYNSRQVLKAQEESFVIYHYEWLFEKPDVLGPFGAVHVRGIAARLPTDARNVYIQASADPLLDQVRMTVIINALTEMGVADAATRVYVGPSRAEGLYGDEAERAYQQLIFGASSGAGGSLGNTGLGGLGGPVGGLGGFGAGLGGIGGGFGGIR
jgi:hypothetical protein